MPFTNETEEKQVERAVLVGLSCPGFNADQAADERTMDELRALAETAGAEAVAMTLQRRPAPDARTFIGEGKAEEVKALAEANDASLILFDNELSPSQMSNLEELTGRTVLDRSALILDIFAQRARTGEGKLQVELAQYQYILPRLAGMGKAMSRLGGGIGTRGPGESKLESDRRHIRSRIDKLRRDLEQVRQVRAVQRRQRKKTELPMVAIVGYTNAGKSTLLNTLTGAGIEANDRLFDTLDPTTRKKRISDTQEILLSDTVGFIRKLPHHLVSAFKATLEELAYADLLLHVVDVSDEDWQVQAETVDKVIAQLGAQDMRLPIQLALSYPERVDAISDTLDFYTLGELSFFAPDLENTPCLRLAMDAARTGGTAACVMSAANEEAVHMFLDGRLGYNRIYDCAAAAVEAVGVVHDADLDAILEADAAARRFARENYGA